MDEYQGCTEMVRVWYVAPDPMGCSILPVTSVPMVETFVTTTRLEVLNLERQHARPKLSLLRSFLSIYILIQICSATLTLFSVRSPPEKTVVVGQRRRHHLLLRRTLPKPSKTKHYPSYFELAVTDPTTKTTKNQPRS